MKYTVVKDTPNPKPYILFQKWNEEMEEIARQQGKIIIGTIKLTGIDKRYLTTTEFNKIKKDIKKYKEY